MTRKKIPGPVFGSMRRLAASKGKSRKMPLLLPGLSIVQVQATTLNSVLLLPIPGSTQMHVGMREDALVFS
jgi:hypothetical protein